MGVRAECSMQCVAANAVSGIRVLIAVLAVPVMLGAQAPSDRSPPRATVVRLRVLNGPQFWKPVELVESTRDTIVVKGTYIPHGPAEIHRFPRSSIARLEYKVPRSSGEGAKHGAKVGAIAGFLTGFALTFPAVMDGACDPDGGCWGWMIFGIGTAGFTLTGTVLGALIGHGSPGVNWVCIPDQPCKR